MATCNACCESFSETDPEYPYKGYNGYCIPCAKAIYEEETRETTIDDQSSDKPECKLLGGDGNVFTIIGNVRNSLNKSGRKEKAKEFMDKAFKSHSYDDVLKLAEEYVEIT